MSFCFGLTNDRFTYLTFLIEQPHTWYMNPSNMFHISRTTDSSHHKAHILYQRRKREAFYIFILTCKKI